MATAAGTKVLGGYAPRSVRNPFSSPLWQNAAFVRVWSAATISIFGSLITRMALPFVAILVLGAGAFEVALVRSIDLELPGGRVDRLRELADGFDLASVEGASPTIDIGDG